MDIFSGSLIIWWVFNYYNFDLKKGKETITLKKVTKVIAFSLRSPYKDCRDSVN